MIFGIAINFVLAIIVFVGFFLIFVIFHIIRSWLIKKRQVRQSLDVVLFSVKSPFLSPKTETFDYKQAVAVMEQFYASLTKLKQKNKFLTWLFGSPHLAFEIAVDSSGESISFYIAVPRHLTEIVEKQIHGFFPDSEVERIDEYNIFNPKGKEAIAYVQLKKKSFLPIKTYQNLESDPLSEITTALSKIDKPGEGAAIQILLKPISGKWISAGAKAIQELQNGASLSAILNNASIAKFVKKLFISFVSFVSARKSNSENSAEQQIQNPANEQAIKLIQSKISKVSFGVNLRLVASADTQERANQLLVHLSSAFNQFNAPDTNNLRIITAKPKHKALHRVSKRKLIYYFIFRIFNNRNMMILSTEELASIFHFQAYNMKTPKLSVVKSKTAPVPADMPEAGLLLGENIYRGQKSNVYLSIGDRRRHLYIIGQTGTGKTSLIKELVRQDIEQGRGVGVLDPHEDLVESILGYIPKHRMNDVIYFNPADLESPIGLNMLEYNPAHPEQKTFIVNELINIFDKLYDLKTTGGPMFEQYTRNALLLLMDDPLEPITLMEVPRVLTDKDFRARLLAKCKDPSVKNFWKKEAEKAGGEASLANIVPYITSKFNIFIANDYMRPIIGQTKSGLDFRDIMDNKKILLVNLTKGRLGDINSALLGLIVVGKMLIAAFSRVDISEENRQDFYLYLDEFQNFATASIATILSEARKYKLNLTLAHQFIGQLSDEIKGAVFGNAGNMVSMRVGAEDAEFLVKQFAPVFDQNDLINLDNFTSFVKMQINGKTAKPFSMHHFKPADPNLEFARLAKTASKNKYGKSRSEVEQEIKMRIQQS